jgi:hypothetical protein
MRTAEEAILIAALEQDDAELETRIDELLPGEMRALFSVCTRIQSALHTAWAARGAAERAAAAATPEEG